MALGGNNLYLRCFFWGLYLTILVILVVILISLCAPRASGSGIPQMEAILSSGIYVEGFFQWRTFIAKMLGLILLIGSGKNWFNIFLCTPTNFVSFQVISVINTL